MRTLQYFSRFYAWYLLRTNRPQSAIDPFNAIKKQLEGVTQKALTQCLRRLERNGLVSREVIADSPVAVQYEITPLGRTLQPPFRALYAWTIAKMPEVEQARQAFDQRWAR